MSRKSTNRAGMGIGLLPRIHILVSSIFVLANCAVPVLKPDASDMGLSGMNEERIIRHIETLSSDQFLGRLPGSIGEELTTDYLRKEFMALGLEPAGDDKSYLQSVPMVGITMEESSALSFDSGTQRLSLTHGKDFMIWTKRVLERIAIQKSELVFIGYGIQAPEFGWDDFKGQNLEGKTLIVLVNDPPATLAGDPPRPDPAFFGGKAMTYYGRWTYKFEMAAEKGAQGCFIIHETEQAGYPWEVVRGSWGGEQFDLMETGKDLGRCEVEGWLTNNAARQLFSMAGKDFAEFKEAAAQPDFEPVELGVQASVAIKNSLDTIRSNNVVAKLEGNSPYLKDEHVVFLAHWDHLGQDLGLQGDTIYNGAVDNASGTAGLLEIAAAFTQLQTPPDRSLLFLAVTAEEQGLLGSRYFVENPIYPLGNNIAAINMDAMNVWGLTRDVTVVGMGNSGLDDLIRKIASKRARIVRPDPEPEKGFFYRSDHFSFAKKGVPTLYIQSGIDYIGRPEGWGTRIRDKYTRESYHKPSDEIGPEWDIRGLLDDLQLLFLVGEKLSSRDWTSQ